MDDSYDAASTACSSEYEEETNTTSECLPNALAALSYDSSRGDMHSEENSINPVSISPEQLLRGAGARPLATISTLSNSNNNRGGASEKSAHVPEEEIESAPKSPETALLYKSARRGTDAPSSIEPSPRIQPVVKEHEAEASYESVTDEEYDVDEEFEEDVPDEEYEVDAEEEEEVPFKAAISEGASLSSILQSACAADTGRAASPSNSKPHLVSVDDGTPLDMVPHPAPIAGSSRDTNKTVSDPSDSQLISEGKKDISLSLDMLNSAAPPETKKEDDTPLTHKTVTQSPNLDASDSGESSPFTPVTPPPTFLTPENIVHPTGKESSESSAFTPLTRVEPSAIIATNNQQSRDATTSADNVKSSDMTGDGGDSMPEVPAAVEGVSVIAVVPDEVSLSSSSVSSLSYKGKSNATVSNSRRSSASTTPSSNLDKYGPTPPRFQYMTEEERRSHQVLMRYVLLAEDKMNKDWRTRSLDDCRSILAKMIPSRQQALANLEKR